MKLLQSVLGTFVSIVSATFVFPTTAFAQTDEIQVYDAVIAEPGVFNLTWHNNFIADGAETPAFPGGLIPDKSFNGVTEWAYGVADWFEAGLYLPLYSISQNRGATINGGKLRALFVRPHAADHTFFYGINFEFSYNALHWEPYHFTSEIRPIIGWHLHPVDIIVNPILDNSLSAASRVLISLRRYALRIIAPRSGLWLSRSMRITARCANSTRSASSHRNCSRFSIGTPRN